MIKKQIVYLPVKVEGATGNYIPDKTVLIVKEQYDMDKDWEALVKRKDRMILFTPEELETFCKGLLDRAADNAKIGNDTFSLVSEIVDKESITSVLKDYLKDNIEP